MEPALGILGIALYLGIAGALKNVLSIAIPAIFVLLVGYFLVSRLINRTKH